MKIYWQWPVLFDVIFAASVSLISFERLLDFFLTPTINKIFVFLSLFAFFYLLFLFFITPILNGLKAILKALLSVLLISLVLTGAFYVVLPEQKLVIRTVHTLEVSISPDSGPVNLEDLLGPNNGEIPWSDVTYDGIVNNALVKMPPGGELSYSREMTGGPSFTLNALEKASEAIVVWDGVQSTIQLPVGEPVELVMDPTSVGNPSSVNQALALIIKINEWLGLFLALVILLGSAILFLNKGGFQYRIFRQKSQRYLMDYLILGGVLLLIAVGLRAFSPDPLTKNLIILLPGLVFLIMKALYWVMPSLPLILFSLILVVNIFAHWVWFDPIPLRVKQITDQTFNELVLRVNPIDSTVMSLGFYKQLRGSELVLAAGSYLAEDDNVARLNRINYHQNIYVLDYPGELSAEDYNRLMALDGWTTWDMRHPGSFYFFQADRPVTSPIVVFTYLDDILLIPEDQLDDLGLFNDFIFN